MPYGLIEYVFCVRAIRVGSDLFNGFISSGVRNHVEAELLLRPVSVSNFKFPHKYFALTFESHLEEFSSNVYKPARKN